MFKIIFTFFMTLIFYSKTTLAVNFCTELFNRPIYSGLINIDSQAQLRNSWQSLFNSDPLVSLNNFSKADTAFLGATSEQVFKSFPSEIQKAIRLYSEISGGYGGKYESVNVYLREYVKDRALSKRSIKPSKFPNSVAEMAKLIEIGILNAPSLPKDLLLFRGLAIDPSFVKVGEIFKDFAFTSTSLDPIVAYQFAQVSARNGHTPHLFVIELKSNDVHGILLTANKENEILLQRGLDMKVQKISERSLSVRSPGIYYDRTIQVPFRIVHLTIH